MVVGKCVVVRFAGWWYEKRGGGCRRLHGIVQGVDCGSGVGH